MGCEFLGRYWGGGGGSLGAVIIGRVVYGFQYGLGVSGLWVSMYDVFWVLFGVVVLDGGFGLRFPLCVCARVACCIWHFYRRGKKHFNKCARM